MIHKIKLKNFKQHTELELDFTNGLNTLTGNNGAGKSTILKAIMYGLFGASAAGNKAHLATWGSTAKMEVELHATIAGKSLIILRSFEKSVIYHDNALQASGQSPCTKFIEQELGLDAKTFKHLLYASQGETQALLKMGASDLQRKIESITKLDEIDKILGFISEDLSTVNGKLAALPEPSDLGAIVSKKDELEKAVDWKRNLIKQREQMTLELRQQVDARAAVLARMTANVQLARQAKTAYDTLSSALGKVNQELNELPVPINSSKVLELQLEGMQSYLAKQEKVLRQSTTNFEKLELLRNELAKARKVQLDFQVLAPRYDERLELYKAKADAYSYMLRVGDKLDELEKVKTECPTCNRPFESQEHLASHVEQLSKAKGEFSKADAIYRKLNSELNEFDKTTGGRFLGNKEAEKARLDKAMKEAQENFYSAKEMLEILSPEEQADLKARVEETQNKAYETKKELESTRKLEAQRNALISQIRRLNDELSHVELIACDWTDEDLENAEGELKFLNEKFRTNNEDLLDARYGLKEAESTLKLAQEQFERVRAEQARREAIEKEQAERKELQKYLRDNRTRMLSETWDSITSLTSGYTSDITEGLITNLIRDESGEFYVQEGEHIVPVAELSGAREAIVGLSLRIALGRSFFGDSSFILLDEVDSAATDDTSLAIASVLSNLDTQVLMVSHRQGVNSCAANVIVL